MDIEEDVLGASIRVGDLEQVRSGLSGQLRGGRVGAAGDEQPVVRGDLADRRDGGLDGVGPGRGREIVGLVHNSEDNVRALCVFGGEGGPESGEFCLRWISTCAGVWYGQCFLGAYRRSSDRLGR